ncbi:MAG TPA: MlaD family protein [Thermodesulfobacteriota bacterium]|nr:MlaD family protein [Thermodesulfobacteriota bacterium]
MSKPANKTLIGIFVLGAIALAVVAIVVLGSGKFFKKSFPAVSYFEGSVGGLNVGAPLVLRGAKVGTVTSVKLRFEAKSDQIQIPVFLEIEPERLETKDRSGRVDPVAALKLLIDRGLRARLEPQSLLTGQMQVALDFYPERPARFVGADPGYPEIPTIPTPLQELAKRVEQLPLEQIIKDIGSAVAGINRFVNSPEITKSLRSVSVAADEAKDLIGKLDVRIDPLVSNIEAAVKDAQKLLQDIDRQVEPLGPSIRRASDSLEKTLQSADGAFHSAQRAIGGVEANIGEDSPLAYQINKTLEEVSNLARAIRQLADYLERHPESVLRGKGGDKK